MESLRSIWHRPGTQRIIGYLKKMVLHGGWAQETFIHLLYPAEPLELLPKADGMV